MASKRHFKRTFPGGVKHYTISFGSELTFALEDIDNVVIPTDAVVERAVLKLLISSATSTISFSRLQNNTNPTLVQIRKSGGTWADAISIPATYQILHCFVDTSNEVELVCNIDVKASIISDGTYNVQFVKLYCHNNSFTCTIQPVLEVEYSIDDVASDESIVSVSDAVVADGGNTTSTFKTGLTSITDDFWNDLTILFTSGNNAGQARKILDYDGTTKFITVSTAFSNIPAGTDTFLIIGRVGGLTTVDTENIVHGVWDEQKAGHVDVDSFGKIVQDIETDVDAVLVDTNEMQGKLPTDNIMGSAVLTSKDDEIDAILVDTGTTLPAQITTHDTDVKANLATNLVAITSIQNNTRFTSATPEQMQKPDSGDTAFRWTGNLYDTDGNMEDPVNNEILIRVLQADGTAITANLYKENALTNPLDDATDQVNFPTASGWRAMEWLAVGQYDLFYKVASDETEEALTVEFSWDEGGQILKQTRSTEVSDVKGDIEDIQTKVDAIHVKVDAPTPSPTIPVQITTHDTDVKALPNVKTTPEYLVVPSGVTRINIEGGVDDSITTIPVYDVSAIQTEGVVLIGTEYVIYTGISVDNELTGCTRGAYSSSAAAHADNAQVYEVFVYPLRLMVYDNEGNMVAPDSAPTIEIVDWNGTQELAPTAMTLISTGLYGYDYIVASTARPESKTLRFSITVDSITGLRQSTLMLLDEPASIVEINNLVGGGTGEFVVTQDGYYDSSNIFHAWTDSMVGYLRDATTGSRLDDVLVTAYKVINGQTIVALIPPGQIVCDVNGNYELRLDAGTYTFKLYKDQYRFPTDEVERTVTS